MSTNYISLSFTIAMPLQSHSNRDHNAITTTQQSRSHCNHDHIAITITLQSITTSLQSRSHCNHNYTAIAITVQSQLHCNRDHNAITITLQSRSHCNRFTATKNINNAEITARKNCVAGSSSNYYYYYKKITYYPLKATYLIRCIHTPQLTLHWSDTDTYTPILTLYHIHNSILETLALA